MKQGIGTMVRVFANLKNDYFIKISASISFILIMVALITIRESPATSYEPSIYEATPPLVWVCLIFAIACGIGIIVHQAYKGEQNSNLWLVGLALIVLSNVIFLSLHILRGYALWGGMADPATHLGLIKKTIETGYTTSFYPATHIHLAELALILGIDPVILFKWVPVLFAILFMVFMFFLAKSLLPHKGQVMLATVAGTVLVYGWYLSLTPNHLSNLVFPMALYLLVRSYIPGTWPWKVLFLIAAALLPVYHPAPGFALMIFILTFWIPEKVFAALGNKASQPATSHFQFNVTAFSLLLVWSISWLSSFYVWARTIKNLQTVMIEGSPLVENLISSIAAGQAYGFSVTAQFFKLYGGPLIYILMAAVAFAILWKRASTEASLKKPLALSGPIVAIGLIIVLLYLTNLGFGPTRLLAYGMIGCSVLVGFTLYEFIRMGIYRANWLAKVVPFLVATLLLALSIHQMSTVYPSPYIVNYNYHTTKAEITGVGWFFHKRIDPSYTSTWRIRLEQYKDFLLPAEARFLAPTSESPIPESWREDPRNLGYDNHIMIGQSYRFDAYLIINELGRMLHSMFPTLPMFNVSETAFVKLENDPTADKLYSNGGLEVWHVYTVR